MAEETWGCPNHPNATIRYHPLYGNICERCGHRQQLLKATY